jgi:hypothetical protein
MENYTYPTFDLSGKKALVTGGSKGIGLAIAAGLAHAGAEVLITGRNEAALREAAEGIKKQGHQIYWKSSDVTLKTEVEKLFEYIDQEFGQIDILVNNAGMNIRKPLVEVEEEDWDKVMGTNLKGIFLVGQQAAKRMIDQKSGRLVATEKLKRFFETDISELRVGQKVSLAIYEMEESYVECLINLRSYGRLYLHAGEENLYIGDQIDGYIEDIRPDGKITLSRFPIGYNTVRTHDASILKELQENGGFLPYGDKTPPEKIQEHFGLSKKAFKKLIGGLFREGKIIIQENGIALPISKKKNFKSRK